MHSVIALQLLRYALMFSVCISNTDEGSFHPCAGSYGSSQLCEVEEQLVISFAIYVKERILEA